MLSVYTVSFFGHRMLQNPMQVEKEIEDLVRQMIREKEYVEFLVGRDGDFDLLVASCIMRIKKELFDANSSLIWVQPYPLSSYLNHPQDLKDIMMKSSFLIQIPFCTPKLRLKSAIKPCLTDLIMQYFG